MSHNVHKKSRGTQQYPLMVWASSDGRVFDEPGWRAAGRRGREFFPLAPQECIPLPEGSELFILPGRLPMGYRTGDSLEAFEDRAEKPVAVAAFLPPAYTQHYLPAYRKTGASPLLPLYAYTAVSFMDGKFWVPAHRVDEDRRQDPAGFDCRLIEEGISRMLASSPRNRLYGHLSHCARTYFCPAARNLFLERWEAPLPSSPSCNARCVGCISSQPSGCCPASQGRIRFVPRPEEISEVAVNHFRRVPDGVASFGQGCEGEPLLVADVLERAVSIIRDQTGNGTLNLNTNGSQPAEVERLAAAGLDAIRVSMNSAVKSLYEAYYRPVGYGFDAVVDSLKVARKNGLFCSLNYFVFPGVTDQRQEIDALSRIIDDTGLCMIQWRNLNIDPDLYADTVPTPQGSLGIPRAMAIISERFPHVRHGYFNPSKNKRWSENEQKGFGTSINT